MSLAIIIVKGWMHQLIMNYIILFYTPYNGCDVMPMLPTLEFTIMST